MKRLDPSLQGDYRAKPQHSLYHLPPRFTEMWLDAFIYNELNMKVKLLAYFVWLQNISEYVHGWFTQGGIHIEDDT